LTLKRRVHSSSSAARIVCDGVKIHDTTVGIVCCGPNCFTQAIAIESRGMIEFMKFILILDSWLFCTGHLANALQPKSDVGVGIFFHGTNVRLHELSSLWQAPLEELVAGAGQLSGFHVEVEYPESRAYVLEQRGIDVSMRDCDVEDHEMDPVVKPAKIANVGSVPHVDHLLSRLTVIQDESLGVSAMTSIAK
jgi:hypothetical protein